MLNLLTQWHFQYFQKLKVTNNKLLIVFIFCYCFLNNNIIAQKIFSSEYSSDSDLKVFIVDYESQADLKVFKVNYTSQAKGNEGLWYFVDYKSQADKKVFFVKYKSQSDLKVFFVKYKSQAGWRNRDKMHLLY